ncbi:GntR family transcriptional regulator [Lentisphaerota bacterium ZTH]|nr:GntR family transcriptional regulator [Lentisphaerota bacterium]WET07025.1 GntR family transcriptional regulator [Lentisphaerota bacterium ZTH]
MASAIISEISLEFNSGIPVYKQIFNQLSNLIAGGRFASGDKLPSIRELSSALGINPNTVARTFLELELKGYIECRRGNGSFVSSKPIESVISEAEKEEIMERLFNNLVAEAKSRGLNETDISKFFNSKKS